ncbi:MAG: HAMP domain-containing histidine kinase [Bdellovibrionaceae bacterium]|jgi:signal transduction histidine kinase|nr:HAMP domain-containing histidine kinase [Pseudobdellovibrionaceae bacterium]
MIKLLNLFKFKSPSAAQEEIRVQNYIQIANNSIPETVMSFVLLLIVIWATPIEKRLYTASYSFLFFTLALSCFRLLLIHFQDELIKNRKKLWSYLFIGGTVISGITWGLFSSYVLFNFELSWTSFFIILIIVALAASQVANLASQFKFFVIYTFALILPSIIGNFIFIGKLQGGAIGLFFTSYMFMLVWLGKTLNEQFWKAKQGNSRISAMVDALPGALAWINSEGQVLGLNKKLGELIHHERSDIKNHSLSKLENAEFLNKLSVDLFSNKSSYDSQIIPIEGRTFFFVAQKYHHNSEAVILGIDITEQKIWENEVEKLRNQAFKASKFTNIGEMMTGFIDDIQQPMSQIVGLFPQLKSELESNLSSQATLSIIENQTLELNGTIQALSCFTQDTGNQNYQAYQVQNIIVHLRALLEDHCKNHLLSIYINDVSEDIKINCKPSEILQVFFSLFENALDANENGKEDWVKMGVYTSSDKIKFCITDSGNGVEEFMEDIIFEPSYTTKESMGGTGVGLSVSKELIESHKGKIFYNTKSKYSQFVITLPRLH